MSTFFEQRPEKLYIGEMTHSPFGTHVHAVAEVLVLTAGTAVLTVDEKTYHLQQGDTLAVFPLVPHSYDRMSGDVGGVVAIFPTELIPEYTGIFHGMKPESPLLPAAKTDADMRLAAHRLSQLRMEENAPMCIAYLHVILASVLHRLSFRPVYDYSGQELGTRILRYISNHACEEITLESASHALGISTSHLSHFFSEQLHTNFRRFINTIRIDKARLLMRDPNRTLTEVCGACGFTNMRTFRRAFQAEMNCLPSDHLAALRSRTAGEE